jgi:hypothetical protein
VWTKAEEHVVKIEKEYCKENCIEPIIIDFCDDDSDDDTFNLTLVKKYLKTANIIDESSILAIVLRNYSTKPSYIFQLKRELKIWKYIFNLFHLHNLKTHFSFRFLHVYKLKMSYRIEQNDNDIFFILYDI